MLDVFLDCSYLMFWVVFLIDYIRNIKGICAFKIAAALLCVAPLLGDLLTSIFWLKWKISIFHLVVIFCVGFLRNFLMGSMGLFCIQRSSVFGKISASVQIISLKATFREAIFGKSNRMFATPRNSDINRWAPLEEVLPKVLIIGIALIIFAILFFIYSKFIFMVFAPQLLGLDEGRPFLGSFVLAAGLGVNEEIVYRLGVQNYFVYKFGNFKYSYFISVIFSSVAWWLIHIHTIDSEVLKFAQIIPIGIMLGYIFRYFGLVGSSLVHVLFNVIVLYFGF